ncbi:MAG: amidohydrolase family protein [Planctomycetota bacterium]
MQRQNRQPLWGQMNRRTSLVWGAIGGFGMASGFSRGSDDQPAIPIIDCHTHFYDPSRPEGVPWPDSKDESLYRTVLPESFKRLAQPLGIVGTVVVEASAWVEDNQWLLDLSSADPYLLGIVGRIALASDAFPEQLERFARNRRYRGIRVLTQELRDESKGADTRIEHCNLLVSHDLELDVNGGPETPQHVATLASSVPDLRIVINHVGNLPIDGREPPRSWIEGMENAARHPNVFCKVSALVEQSVTRPAPEQIAYYAPVLDTLWRVFGEDRLIFGSNWPVSDLGAPLETVVHIVREYFFNKGERAVRKFFSENALSAYRWPG